MRHRPSVLDGAGTRARALAAILLLAVAAPAAAAQEWDIAGIRLGMTEAEARAALTAFDAGLKVVPVMGVFNYSDGVNPILKTPEFLDRLEGSKGNEGVSVKVYFSGPVGEVRVISVYRTVTAVPAPPTASQFVQALFSKYGQPSGTSRANKQHLVWESSGKPSCIRIKDGNRVSLDAVSGTSLMVNAAVEQFFTQRRNNIMGRGLIPNDLTQCGAYLGYNYMGDPVRSFFAEANDLGAMVATERSRTAWVKQLQAEAVRKRQGQGQAPKL